MKTFWKIKNEADDEAAEMMIYGQISDETWFGDEITPRQFAEDLKQCGGKNLAVHVNSPGGDVFAAQAIYSQLKNYSGTVTMHIDGMCASAATVITCAGDKVVMPDNAIFMIHNPSCMLFDSYDSAELSQMADQLDAVKQTIVNVYMKRCGNNLSEKKICQKMDDETWMSAQEALDCGFIDEIDDSCKVKNSMKDGCLIVNSVKCDLKKFKNTAHISDILNKKEEKEGEKFMDSNEIVSKISALLGISPKDQQTNTPETPKDVAADERQRITDLLAMKNGNALNDKIIDTAVSNGNTPEQIKPFLDVIPKEEAKKEDPLQAIKDLIKDNQASGADGVHSAPGMTPEDNEAAKKQAAIDEVVNFANQMRGVK